MSGLLCYPPCPTGTKGIGPVCWGYCPTGTKQCGVLCLTPEQTCSQYIANITGDVLEGIGQAVIEDVPGAVASAAGVALDLTFPICENYT